MQFLPEDYVLPAASNAGSFLPLPKAGESIRIVVLSGITPGYSYWDTNKQCFRSKEPFNDTPGIRVQDGKADTPKYFWAFHVLNVDDSTVKIVEVTQRTIMEGLIDLVNGGDYNIMNGSVAIKISRTGTTMKDTKYSLLPVPTSESTKAMYTEALNDKSSWPSIENIFKKPEPKINVPDLAEKM